MMCLCVCVCVCVFTLLKVHTETKVVNIEKLADWAKLQYYQNHKGAWNYFLDFPIELIELKACWKCLS